MICAATPKNCARLSQVTRCWPMQADVGLVHERRRLQRVIAALAPQIGGGPLAKLLVDERHQILARLQIASPPCLEQLTDRPGMCGLGAAFSECRRPADTEMRQFPRRLRVSQSGTVRAWEVSMSAAVIECRRRRAMRRAGSMCGWRGRAPSSPLGVLRRPIGCSCAPGTFVGSPLLHLHALLFSAWTLFFLLQTTFAARGRVRPSSRLGPARHLARDRHGARRLRGRG